MAILNNALPKNLTEYPNSFKRQGSFPLEAYSVFYDIKNEAGEVSTTALNAAKEYAKNNPVAYVGQYIAVVSEDGTVQAYIIGTDGSLEEFGGKDGTDNQAPSENAHAEGYNTFAGGKGFTITAVADNGDGSTGNYTLSSVTGLEVGMKYSAVLSSANYNAGTITAINDNIVTVDGYKHIELNNKVDDPENFNVYNCFLIVNRPDLGDKEVGFNAHAEGENTIASNKAAHAEGSNTKAIGKFAHAEGNGTIAGHAAHAEGANTKAIGKFAHAEGYGTIAEGDVAHAEGINTKATGNYSHTEGNNTVASAQGTHAEGENTKASGGYAHAEGESTQAIGWHSHAEGQSTLADGWAAHAEGYNTVASGTNAHAEGINTKATGNYSHTEGNNTVASAQGTHAEGENTIASNKAAHAEGANTKASGGYAHAEGESTQAIGWHSHAEGQNTLADGWAAHAEGYNTVASSDCAHSEGANTEAIGKFAHAEGYYSKAYGEYSHAGGNGSIASGFYSLAFGDHVYAAGEGAVALGASIQRPDFVGDSGEQILRTYYTSASGTGAFACGQGSTAQGDYSVACGQLVYTRNPGEVAFGRCNASLIDKTIFTIGNGELYDTSNLFQINQDGAVYLADLKSQTVRDDAISLQEQLERINERLDALETT